MGILIKIRNNIVSINFDLFVIILVVILFLLSNEEQYVSNVFVNLRKCNLYLILSDPLVPILNILSVCLLEFDDVINIGITPNSS